MQPVRAVVDAAGDAASSPWAERLASAGLVARGTTYCVIAVLAIQVPTGGASPANKDGALVTVAHQPLGRALVLGLAVGFAAYAAWRFLEAAVGRRGEHGWKGAALRAGDAGRGLIYLVLLGSAMSVLTGEEGSTGDKERGWSAQLLGSPAGRVAVISAGVVLVGLGGYWAVRGARQRFRRSLETGRMSRRARCWLPRLGTVGYVSRGVVAAIIGWFLVQAAVQYDPADSVGVDGALRRLADRAYGPFLLWLVACGLLAFGLFSFVEARYRRVLENAPTPR